MKSVRGNRLSGVNGHNQIKYGAVLSYVGVALSIIIGLLYTPWMTEKLGQSQYGLYTLSNSLISLFVMDFGLSSAVTKYISQYRAEGDEDKANSFIGTVYKLFFLIDAVVFVALFLVFLNADTIYISLTYDEIRVFKIVFAIASISSIVNLPLLSLNGILISYEKFIQLKLINMSYQVASVLLAVLFLYLGYGICAIVTINAVTSIISNLLKYASVKRNTPIKANFKKTNKETTREIFSFSLWATIAALSGRLVFNIMPTVLGMVSNTVAISVFGIVSSVEGYFYTITGALNGMFTPKIARIYSKDNSENDIMRLMINVGRLQYLIDGLLVVGFVSIGKEFIHIWLGDAYSEAYFGIVLVVLPGLFYNVLEIGNSSLVVRNKVNVQAGISLIIGIVNVVLAVPLARKYGVLGACVAISIAYTLRAVLYNYELYHQLRLDMWYFSKECLGKMSPPFLLSLLCGIIQNHVFSADSWFLLCLKGLTIVFVYILSAWFLVLNAEMRTGIKTRLRR